MDTPPPFGPVSPRPVSPPPLRDDDPDAATQPLRMGDIVFPLLDMSSPEGAAPAQPAPSLEVLAGRYELRKRLGVGGYGSVFLAFDAVRDHEVALKVLRADLGARPAHLMRFRREFRAISRLDHPNCLRVFDEGRDGDRYFFTMEVVRGGDLEKLSPDTPDAARLDILLQVADALDYIHGRRIVHRDLKPANILLHQPVDGVKPTPKLADFGLARPIEGGATITQTGAVLGTIAFMSPEQILGQTIDPRSDLYAFGCAIYALWSGKTPFEHLDNPFQILQSHLHSPPPPLTQPDGTPAPPALARLAARLLAKDPMDRPQGALEVRRLLAALLAEVSPSERVTLTAATPHVALLPSPAQGQFLYRPPLIGREDERQRARALIDRVIRVAPDAPLLIGLCAPAGMGKSRLLSILCDDLRNGGWHIAQVAVSPNPSAPFAPFLDLAAALDDLPDPPAIPAPPPAAPLAASTASVISAHTLDWSSDDRTFDQPIIDDSLPTLALPSVRAHVAAPTFSPQENLPGEQLDPDRARRLRAQALAHRLAYCPQAPLAIVFEDIHDLDPSSEAFLYDLLSALDVLCASSPQARWPLLISTLRPGDLRDRLSTRVRTRSRAVSLIDLLPLDRAQIERMLAVMMGLPLEAIKPSLVDQVIENTSGNPLFVQSYLQALVDRGLLHRTLNGAWTLSDDLRAISSASVDLPDAMARILRDRLHLLSANTLKLMRVAALIGRRFDSALLQEASASPQDALLDAIDEALRAWVIQSTPGAAHLDIYSFEHARLVDVLLVDLSPTRRRVLHDAIAAALQKRPDTAASTLAAHLASGSNPHLAIPHLTVAAQAAADAYDHQAALDLYQRALSLSPTPNPDLQARCADLLNYLGRPTEARAHLELLLKNPPADPFDRAVLQYKLARTLFFSGHTDIAFATYDQTLRSLGDAAALRRWRLRLLIEALRFLFIYTFGRALPAPSPHARPALNLRALCHSDLGVFLYWSNLEKASTHQLAYANLAARQRDPALTLDALGGILLVQGMYFSHRVGQRTFQRAQSLCAKHPHLRAKAARVSAFAGIAEAYNDNPDAARRLLDDALHTAESQGDRFLIGFVHRVSGWCSTLSNRFPDALTHFQKALDLAQELNDQRGLADTLLGQAGVNLYMGHSQNISDNIATAQAIADRLNIPAFQGLADETRGGLHFLQRDYASACHLFERAEATYTDNKLFAAWGFLVHIHHAEALLFHHADPSANTTLLSALQPLRKRARFALRQPVFHGFLPLLSGVIAARKGQRAAAIRLFDRALSARPPHSTHVFQGLILQRVAQERSRLGDPPAVTDPLLDRAYTIFDLAHTHGLRDWLSI
jgi:eukaryotic-like serine/threonine-protein kinase